VKDEEIYLSQSVYSVEMQPIESQKRVQGPACLIIACGHDGGAELVAVVDDEGEAACGCEDGWVTLCFGGCELLAAEFFKGNLIGFRCSLAQAFLYVISSKVELKTRKNIHVCPLHTEPRRLQGCALAIQCPRRFVYAVSKDCEPNRESGDQMGCGGTSR
jgi:hypothetical protein